MTKWPIRSTRRRIIAPFLSRLARDTGGNTLAMMAAAFIPLAGMVGGGIDISRMYILKTRMQHACDAGALAGRRAMGAGTWGFNNYYSRDQANRFFDANFETGSYGSYDLSRVFTERAGKVTGTVRANIPMTLMRIFGIEEETLDVTCDAEMRLPNTDVMFVLDTTGSMASPQPGDSVAKIDALKVAVKCFYEIVARLDTNAACTTGTPSGGTGDQVQIRFGFVPFAVNANVGKLLPTAWFADSWNYDTRQPVYKTTTTDTWQVDGTPKVDVKKNEKAIVVLCNDATVQLLVNSDTTNMNGSDAKTVTQVRATGTKVSGLNCLYTKTTTETKYKKVSTSTQEFDYWKYANLPVDVSKLKNGANWRASFNWPVGTDGANAPIGWDGCIEERQTVRAADYQPIPSDAYDLDIDMVPTSDQTTQWGPLLNDLFFARYAVNAGLLSAVKTTNTVDSKYSPPSYASYSCPVEARKLAEWKDASAFDSYVDQLSPAGNTYYDIGLLWGARLLSPTGLFRNENEFTPKGGEIERHLIFMTDGDACTAENNASAYGVAWYARRQTDPTLPPTSGCTSTGSLTQQVVARTAAICTAIRNKNVTLWIVAFGSLATETKTRLEACASPGRYFEATSAKQLQNTFKTIADQISMLRLTT